MVHLPISDSAHQVMTLPARPLITENVPGASHVTERYSVLFR